ncbi:MAG: tetratricopeptide repeat protein [Acidobacteriota bacterium]|nr:MAG: tetratricopeptide repeat protein [Acidobacteriota bacterium]
MARLHKKDVREDEFYTAVDRAYVYLSENAERWFYPLAAVLLVALAVYGVYVYWQSRENKASFLVYEAFRAQENDEPPEAILERWQTVLNRYPRSDAAQVARWYMMHHRLEAWDEEGALPTLEEMADRPDDLGQLASYKLALLYASSERYDEADEILTRLMETEQGFFTTDLLIVARARVFREAGRLSEAEEQYTIFLNEYPASAMRSQVSDEFDALRETMVGTVGEIMGEVEPAS